VPLVRNPPRYSERFVQFTRLSFCTEPPTENIAYNQFYVRVDINSHQENALITEFKPKSTSYSDWEEKELSLTKSGSTLGVTAGFALGQTTQAVLATTAMTTNEVIASSTKKRINSAITEYDCNGNIRWGFNINFLERDIPEVALPTARFQFHGDSNVWAPPKPPPKYMDFVITSYWTILPSEKKNTRAWIQKLLHSFKFRSTGNTQTTSYCYSNLYQIVALTADVSSLPEQSYYRAKLKVKSGVSGPPDVKLSTPSVYVTPAVVDGM
jgi:hypothetical protein